MHRATSPCRKSQPHPTGGVRKNSSLATILGALTIPVSHVLRSTGPVRQALVDFILPLTFAWVAVILFHARFAPVDTTLLAPKGSAFGAITMRLKLPGTWAGIEEPILSCGTSGNATFVYIRIFYHSKAKVGIEFWGLGAYESPEFDLPAQDAEVDFASSFPALFPDFGSPEWQAMSPAQEQHLLHTYVITVNGIVRLRGSITYKQPQHSPVYLGRNTLGGSLVSSAFTGSILAVSQGK